MKFIRWGGLTSFVVIVAIVVTGAVLFSGTLAKYILESQLTDLNNAKVDIDNVDVNYSPFSIKISRIQITNSEQPMLNAAEIGAANFELSFSELLFSKVIINDMSLSGIKFDTPRKYSGKVNKPTEAAGEKNKIFSMLGDALPDVNEVIKNEPLTVDKLIVEFNTDISGTHKNWQVISDDITNKQKWQSYDSQYEKLQLEFKGDAKQKLEAIKSAKKLYADLQAESEKIKQAQQTFNTDITRLNDEFSVVKTSPRDDIRRIREKYNLDNLDAGNVTQMLFGEQAAQWLNFAKVWYARIKPYIEDDEEEVAKKKARIRANGVDIAFKENNPKPAFLIKKASIDAITERGEFAGEMTALSSNQSINKQPMRFSLSGINLKNRDKEEIKAEFNYVNQGKGFSELSYAMHRYQLNDFELSSSDSFPLAINNSLMTVKASARLQQGGLKGNARLNFDKVKFISKESTKGSAFSKMLSDSFTDINEFYVDTNFSGEPDDLSFKLSSDLDNRVGAQFKSKLNDKKQQFENELRAKIEEKIKQPLADIQTKRESLTQFQSNLDDKQLAIQQRMTALQNQINSAQDSKQQELKDKSDSEVKNQKDKAKDKLKGLF